MSVGTSAITCRALVLVVLISLSMVIASCSSLSTFLSRLDADSFSTTESTEKRRIPLPPMAEEFGSSAEGKQEQ